MDMNCYIAMTAAELAGAKQLPAQLGWMACHFSQRDNGISNVPGALPEGAVLILDDSRPPAGHDPALIAKQLAEAVQKLRASSVILDFQDADNTETADIAAHLVGTLPSPVCVAAPYAENLSCPVLIPPPPPHKHLQDWLASWAGRQIWLEATLETERITVTEQGSRITALPFTQLEEGTFTEETLFCRYRIQEYADRVEFTLTRDRGLLQKLLENAKNQGVHQAIGLYQQLGTFI